MQVTTLVPNFIQPTLTVRSGIHMKILSRIAIELVAETMTNERMVLYIYSHFGAWCSVLDARDYWHDETFVYQRFYPHGLVLVLK